MKLIKTQDGYILEDAKKNTIGQTFGKFKGKKLSIKNCQEIERGYDLDELVNEWNVKIETQRKVVSSKVIGSNPKIKGSGDVIKSYETVPKLDADGCLILKRIS